MEKDNLSLFELIAEKIKKIFYKNSNYTIEEYLKILSEFTDSIIEEGKKDHLFFVGGEVIFKCIKQMKKIDIKVNMEFKTEDNQWELKKAERELDYTLFSRETIELLESSEELRYKIEEPKEEI